MSLFQFSICFLLLLFSPLTANVAISSEDDTLQIYIVHVRPPPSEHTGTKREWYESFLPHPSRLLHSYTHVLTGFSAMLTPTELESMRKLEGFVHATPSETQPLHTTHSPSFLQLTTDPSGFWVQSANYGKGMIIGVLDTGIAPTHPSFDGTWLPPPPSKWKGKCNFADSPPCNNKLIGARAFRNGTESPLPPLDDDGHGTHTASTAAGAFVQRASVLGSAMGTAVGMAPFAHLAAYKVCWGPRCPLENTAAAMETAIEDGVDVLSISIGGPAVPLYNDLKAIAGFAAVKHGLFVAISAGNDGSTFGTVENISPWVLTVGASTMDRRIRAVVKLGNSIELEGESAYQPWSLPEYYPLILPQSIVDANASFCTNSTTLKAIGVEGKIVLCGDYNSVSIEKGKVVKEAGGAAMILWGAKSRGYDTYAEAHVIPTSHISYADGVTVVEYMNSTTNPVASIDFKGTAIGGTSDPAVAAFSSRGPSRINNGIMKPDIIGPGVNILAAWHEAVGPFPQDPPFNMISGTSMSCPHLAGVAALLKVSHPDWSPAMIKSAIMTTADSSNVGSTLILDSFNKQTASLFATGAGHVNPTRANNPGLVYDITTDDYISYLCGLNYTDVQVGIIANDHNIRCAKYTPIKETNLNYPSITAFLDSSTGYTARVQRTLTNVECPNSSYKVRVSRPVGITVDVQPSTLYFADIWEKQTFSVTFRINSTEVSSISASWRDGFLVWFSSDSGITVKSPVAVALSP